MTPQIIREDDEESNNNNDRCCDNKFLHNRVRKMTHYQLYFLIAGIILSSILTIIIILASGGGNDAPDDGTNNNIYNNNNVGENNNIPSDVVSLYNTRNEPEQPSPPLPPIFDAATNNQTQVVIAREESYEGEPLWDEINLKELLQEYSWKKVLEDESTPQGQAFQWILEETVNSPSTITSMERLQQRYLLAVFYFYYQTDEWSDTYGWLSHTEHECTWYGIRCGSDGSRVFSSSSDEKKNDDDSLRSLVQEEEEEASKQREDIDTDLFVLSLDETVTCIDLSGNNLANLQGTQRGFPNELQYMTNLVQLILSKNYIDGSIPQHLFSKLTNLHTLYLNENFFTGELPNDFQDLTFLENLALHDNSFHGPVPDSIRFASTLVDIRLQNNEFDGSLPDDFFVNMSNLRVFLAGSNRLEGSIPSSLANSSNSLESIQLYENRLRGTIPNHFASTELRQLHLDNNELLEGPMPQLSSASLEELRLEKNALNGPLSFGEEQHVNLKVLWLHDNSFTGTIPIEIGTLKKLATLKLERNLFTGSVPNEVCELRFGDGELKNVTVTDCQNDANSDYKRSIGSGSGGLSTMNTNNKVELECNCCDSCQ